MYIRFRAKILEIISVFKCGDHADLGITNASQIITAANKLGDRIREFFSMTAVVNGICDAK